MKNKDKKGIEYLYDHYSSALYGIIFRIVRTDVLAEEVLQDSFVNIWNNIHSYDPSKGKLFTWMVNIARNKALDKLRSREVKNTLRTDDIEGTYIQPGEESIKPETIGVKEMLDILPP